MKPGPAVVQGTVQYLRTVQNGMTERGESRSCSHAVYCTSFAEDLVMVRKCWKQMEVSYMKPDNEQVFEFPLDSELDAVVAGP